MSYYSCLISRNVRWINKNIISIMNFFECFFDSLGLLEAGFQHIPGILLCKTDLEEVCVCIPGIKNPLCGELPEDCDLVTVKSNISN